jgi:hypothetical protein
MRGFEPRHRARSSSPSPAYRDAPSHDFCFSLPSGPTTEAQCFLSALRADHASPAFPCRARSVGDIVCDDGVCSPSLRFHELPVALAVVLEAKPHHVKWLAVVIVVRFDTDSRAASFARLAVQATIAKRIVDRLPRSVLLRLARPSASLRFQRIRFPLRRLGSRPIVREALFVLLVVTRANPRLRALLTAPGVRIVMLARLFDCAPDACN